MTEEETQPTDEPATGAGERELAATNVDAKVIGELSGTDGAGIFGRNRTGDPGGIPSGLSVGVYGDTDKSGTTNGEPNAVGVFGNSLATSGETVGVVGRTESSDGIGLVGNSIDSNGTALFASGDATVDGLLTSTEFDASTTDLPVRGHATESGDPTSLPSGLSIGLYGATDKSGTTNGEPNAVGVFGNSVAGSGETIGVVGRTESPGGIGVVGNDTSGDGLAMFASGDADVQGDLEVGGSIRRNAMTEAYLDVSYSVDSATETVIPFDRTAVDEPGAWDTSTHEYTCPSDGHYQVTLNVGFAREFTSDSALRFRFRVNGTTRYFWNPDALASEYYEASFTHTLVALSAGDTIDATVVQRSGESKYLAGQREGTVLQIRYLGDGTA